eukprot:CAMPEP_0183743918 /NCGR_PEP_ID=MMETSP0737-20130205/65465_1 /TAXON_ID=385413 /ORGANISM="Thalassiosira miniscula, Strain CCMP1093" /LENGTH=1005 /DNA_ID=CAMNT_0025979549 /DNA_START=161 /DNA_END=3178 /DNA_ORIENTATION=-
MKYTKPAGAVADLRELEYISALHQTCAELRQDGSIRTEDISKFLLSRFGIRATDEELSDTIAKGFSGGGVSEEDGDTLDLCEVMAMLLVPTLLKAEMSLHRDLLERMRIRNSYLNTNGSDDYFDEFDELGRIKFDDDDELEEHGYDSNKKSSIHKLHTLKAGEDHVWYPKDENRVRSLRGEDRWPDSDLIGFVLSMILRDVTGDDTPKPMTRDLLKKIFVFYGEHEIAEDEGLLDEMISVARDGTASSETPILNEITLAHCLTEDVRAYDITTENRLSTTVQDVFTEMHHGASVPEEDLRSPDKVFTFPAIDYAVDTFRSKAFVILLWVIWAIVILIWINTGALKPDVKCEEKENAYQEFGCRIGQGIVNWLVIMCELVVVGSGSVILCSAGQSDAKTNPLFIIFSMVCVCLLTFVPAFVDIEFGNLQYEDDINGTGIDDHFIDTRLYTEESFEKETHNFFRWIVVVCGIILILLSLQNLIDRMIPVKFQNKYKWVERLLSSGTVKLEQSMKLAAAFKINRMIRNAVAVHKAAEFEHGAGPSSSKDSSYGRALLAYTKKQDLEEEVGGWFWFLKRILSGKLFSEDGIWLNNRMLQGNVAQLIICMALIPALMRAVRAIYDFYEEYAKFIDYLLEGDEMYNVSDYIPEKWRITAPIIIAVTFTMFNAITLSFKYLPSSVRTILEFRYGTIGSLHDRDFLSLRKDVDSASYIFPAMFWGTIASSLFIFFVSLVFFGVIFTKMFFPQVLNLVALVIGAVITILLKTLFLMCTHKYSHERAYYRTRPAVANIVGVILEAWNLGITTLYILKRMVTLIVCAFIFIGRIDINFLSPEADEIGPARLDNFPIVFRKDLLMHDAHRHPYMERIGLMYIMKLRYGDHFGRQAGTSWRLLFVFALFPWFRQFRIHSNDNLQFDTVKFAEVGPLFQKFTELAVNGKKFGRLEMKNSEESDSNEVPREGPRDELKDLRREIKHLKEENEKLKQLETVVDALVSQLGSGMPNGAILEF